MSLVCVRGRYGVFSSLFPEPVKAPGFGPSDDCSGRSIPSGEKTPEDHGANLECRLTWSLVHLQDGRSCQYVLVALVIGESNFFIT